MCLKHYPLLKKILLAALQMSRQANKNPGVQGTTEHLFGQQEHEENSSKRYYSLTGGRKGGGVCRAGGQVMS